ncbi:BON domain-containing protein [Micromonospora sp. NPDC000668]|uniref:BON domain-containing protein n=1 Tax=Micromonospora sp. NPDC000668 TaxID=3364219 RepID=UPI0036CC3CDC
MVTPWPYPDEHARPVQPPPPGQGGPADEDTRIAAAVAQRISSDGTTRRQQIAVSVQNRVVILTGIVTDPATRQVAGDIAWEVTDVFDVCNALRLARPRRLAR